MPHKHEKNLIEIHEDVPASHYDKGIKRNIFQKYWHFRRFHEVLKVINQTEDPILDLGCHSGTFTKQIITKVKSKKVYGIDISTSAIELIKKRIPYGIFKVASAENVPFKSNFFEQIYCLEMLEHVDHPDKVIKEIKRLLKKGGISIILVPSDNKLFKIVWFLWTLYYPVWRHAHVQSFASTSLEKIISSEGLKIIKVKTFNLGMLKLVICEK